jgi:ABC-type antimicrobial peptide transport system permease subunit
MFYRPLAQAPLLTVMFLARTSGDPSLLTQQMREAVHALDPNQPVDQFRTLDQVRAASLSAPRLTTTLIAVFAGIALIITATGLAGVIAFSVNQRSQEFGVRMALGASRSSVLSLVLVQGLRLVAVGLVLGGIAAMAMGSTVRALLFNTEPTDILTYAGVAIVLGIVARVACLMPARRASTVDPLVALRGIEPAVSYLQHCRSQVSDCRVFQISEVRFQILADLNRQLEQSLIVICDLHSAI